jgi:hypothetical protein
MTVLHSLRVEGMSNIGSPRAGWEGESRWQILQKRYFHAPFVCFIFSEQAGFHLHRNGRVRPLNDSGNLGAEPQPSIFSVPKSRSAVEQGLGRAVALDCEEVPGTSKMRWQLGMLSSLNTAIQGALC